MNAFQKCNRRLRHIYRHIRKYFRAFFKYRAYLKFDKDLYADNDTFLIFIHSAQNGGAPLLMLNIAKELKRRGKTAVVLSLEGGELLSEFKDVFPTFLAMKQRKIDKICRHLRERGVNKAFCNGVLTGRCCDILKKHSYRVVSLVHELPNIINNLYAKRSYLTMLEKSDVVVYPSSFVRDRDNASFPTAIKARLEIKPQGLFNKSDKHRDKNSAKEVLGLSGKRVVLNVASTNSRKGFDFFIDAAELCEDVAFIWVGIQHNSYYESCLKKFNGEFPKNFTEVGYVNNIDDLILYYDAADIFLLTSREEPFGSVVMEAFASGSPVIAFDGCGGYIDIVENGETGILVKDKNAVALGNAVKSLMFSGEELSRMSEECGRRAKAFDFDKYVDTLLSFAEER